MNNKSIKLHFVLSSSAKNILLLGLCLSCLQVEPRGSSRSARGSSAVVDNTNTPAGYGRALQDNPIILSGNTSLLPDVNLNTLLKSGYDYISSNQTLTDSCTVNGITVPNDCFQIQLDENTVPLTNSTRKWGYDANSLNFLQVHTFFHQNKVIDRFHAAVYKNFQYAQAATYKTAIPTSLSSPYWIWSDQFDPNGDTLFIYPGCDQEDNAHFSASRWALCYGYDSVYTQLKFAQDPTIAYHETGHALIFVMSNTRNSAASGIVRVNPGYSFYDEAGALNEGWADWFSYYINERTHFAEWALGRFLNASRPISESDSLHIAGVSTASNERLAYPSYLNYEPNAPTEVVEDIHNAGMIASHFLTAFTEDLKTTCGFSHPVAGDYVLYFIHETLSELGDLTTKSSDAGVVGTVNLNTASAYEWHKYVNPVNYRKFFQTFGKYLSYTLSYGLSTACNGTYYNLSRYETLLDNYGLLLFRTYNDNGGHSTLGHLGSNTSITSANRLRSVLVSKDLIEYDPTANAVKAYVIDSRASIKDTVKGFLETGLVTGISSQIPSDFRYNNNNSQISPGEVVGVALNLYNNSNTPMAGVQVLANDWDHFKRGATSDAGKPCNNFEDLFPVESEGGYGTDESPGTAAGDCKYITQDNGATASEIAPACFVQISQNGATNWALQTKLQTQIGLSSSDCLDPTNTESCFIRVIKGADHAFYSKIDPNKTWSKTQFATADSPTLSSSNLIFLEASPWIPPGTVFNCRMRVRFTNCDDCWHDLALTPIDDYLDYEFSGNRPYKIINFNFTVLN